MSADAWRRFIDTTVPAAMLGDALAQGKLVWTSTTEHAGGRWVEAANHVPVAAFEDETLPASTRRARKDEWAPIDRGAYVKRSVS